MDVSDLSPYPMVANTDCSPTNVYFSYPGAFEACLTDSYTTQPINSLELPAAFVRKYPAVASIKLPAANLSSYRPTFNHAPFNHLERFAMGFPFNPITNDSFDSEPCSVSPHNNASPTPSLCDDGPQPLKSSSLELSPRSLKREPPDEVAEEPTPKCPQRKRGRPRLDRNLSDKPSTSSASSKCQRTSRIPHNQVERKYREGLNSELDRLRRAVPTLPQFDEGGSMGQLNPSKAMVLMGAIEYIKKIKRERDALMEENERLRCSTWSKSQRQDSASSFLIDP